MHIVNTSAEWLVAVSGGNTYLDCSNLDIPRIGVPAQHREVRRCVANGPEKYPGANMIRFADGSVRYVLLFISSYF